MLQSILLALSPTPELRLLSTDLSWFVSMLIFPVTFIRGHSWAQITCLIKWKLRSSCVKSDQIWIHSGSSDLTDHRWASIWWRNPGWAESCQVRVLQARKARGYVGVRDCVCVLFKFPDCFAILVHSANSLSWPIWFDLILTNKRELTN